jgi:hypothetical protein
MNKLIITLLSVVITINGFGQNKIIPVNEFSTIEVKNALEVVLIQGDKNEVNIVSADTLVFEHVALELKNNKLSLFVQGKLKTKEQVKLLVTYKKLERIEQSGASKISTANTIKSEKLEIKGSGAIEGNLAVEVSVLSLDFSGASEITLTGSADAFNLQLSGASELKAAGLIAKKVEVNISGASDVQLYASEAISGEVSGASDLKVKGSPSERMINTSGSASYKDNTGMDGTNDDVTIISGKNKVIVSDDNVSVDVFGNTVDVNDDTTRVKLGGSYVLVIGDSVYIHRREKKRRNHWAGLDLGINGFLNKDRGFNLNHDVSLAETNPKEVTQFMELDYAKSWTFSLNFMEFFIPMHKHHFGLVLGMGTEWNNYELKHNIKLNSKGGRFVYDDVNEFNQDYTWGEVDTVLNYSKNRFKTWFVNVPVMLEWNAGNHKNKSFHLSAGAIFGLNLQTKMKYKYNFNGDDKKVKSKQSFNTRPFRTSLTARLGIGWFTVFGTYSITPLFEKNRGPELYPFTVGISILPF